MLHQFHTVTAPALALLLLALLLVNVSSQTAEAVGTTFTVNSAADADDLVCQPSPGTCTLREAIDAANNLDGWDTIVIQNSIAQITPPAGGLPYVDAEDGITVDGGDGVIIQKMPATSTNFGLAFVSYGSNVAHNIDVSHVTARGFDYDGVQVCGGYVLNVGCTSDVMNVTMEDLALKDNTGRGLNIVGKDISGVTINRVGTENNDSGILLQATGAASNVSVSEANVDESTANGLAFTGQTLANVDLTDVTATDSHEGIRLIALLAITDLTILRPTIDGAFQGIYVSSAGTPVTRVSVQDATLSNVTFSISIDGGVTTSTTFQDVEFVAGVANGIHMFGFRLDQTLFSGVTGTTSGWAISTTAMQDTDGIEVTGNSLTAGSEWLSMTSGAVGQGALKNASIHDNQVTAGTDGVNIATDGLSNVGVRDNHINAKTLGVYMGADGLFDVTVEDNFLLTGAGILLAASLHAGERNVVRRNHIQEASGDGIALSGVASVTISRNETTINAELGIDLVKSGEAAPGVTDNDVGDGDSGPNKLQNFPVITGTTDNEIIGTACANCLVELFFAGTVSNASADPSGHGEGSAYLRDGLADGDGNFSIGLDCQRQFPGDLLTATATSPDGNTSEFSLNYELTGVVGICVTPSPSPTPGPTGSATASPVPTQTRGPLRKQGDLDCNGLVNARDALISMLYAGDLPLLSRTPGCPGIGTEDPPFGDLNCDGFVDASDALGPLALMGQVDYPQADGCTPVGDVLS